MIFFSNEKINFNDNYYNNIFNQINNKYNNGIHKINKKIRFSIEFSLNNIIVLDLNPVNLLKIHNNCIYSFHSKPFLINITKKENNQEYFNLKSKLSYSSFTFAITDIPDGYLSICGGYDLIECFLLTNSLHYLCIKKNDLIFYFKVKYNDKIYFLRISHNINKDNAATEIHFLLDDNSFELKDIFNAKF